MKTTATIPAETPQEWTKLPVRRRRETVEVDTLAALATSDRPVASSLRSPTFEEISRELNDELSICSRRLETLKAKSLLVSSPKRMNSAVKRPTSGTR